MDEFNSILEMKGEETNSNMCDDRRETILKH